MNDRNQSSQGRQAVPLSVYTAEIGNALRMQPKLRDAWVTAELSDVRTSGGHWYMELIEKNPTGQTVAKLRANIWASTFNSISRKLSASGIELKSGIKIMVRGATGHHPVYGISFNITDIDTSYTIGDMERLRREILMKLQHDGVIDLNKQKVLSPVPQNIAVISAEGAAGYGDFVNQLTGNMEGFRFNIRLYPATMQGERTSVSVRAALDAIERSEEKWDCVAIIRGGGATTDLNGFDDYELARRVATFPLPIVVGIGHERDRTVLDEIAHTRMKTPTAVAAFFIDTLRIAYSEVAQTVQWIVRYTTERLQGEARRLSNAETMIPALANARLTAAQARLEKELSRIPALVEARLAGARSRVETLGRFVSIGADNVIKRAAMRLDNLSGLLEVLSPSNTLRRGYSITRINGHAVTDASVLKPGDVIETCLNEGIIRSSVTETIVKENVTAEK